MHVILSQDKCIEALKCEASMLAFVIRAEKNKMVNKARSVIIFSLRDKVLMEVFREKNAVLIWETLNHSLLQISTFTLVGE